MKRVLLLAALLGLMITSCKKDDPEENQTPVQTADYMQLKIGNFWVYNQYMVDSGGNETLMQINDSTIITGDTVIGEIVYFKKENIGQKQVGFVRDSMGYLVDNHGKIFFSDHDFTNVLRMDSVEPGLAIAEYRMVPGDTSITVPIGTFNTLDFRGTITALDPQYPHGTQYTHYFYADGYAMIKSSSYFFASPHNRYERRLVNFGNILEGK